MSSQPRSILLARHGSHDEVGHILSGRSEIGLNGRGTLQAAALARHLKNQTVASIHSSPRLRCAATAEPIARAVALPVQTAAALDEIDFGRFAGRSFSDLDRDADWQRWNSERATARCPEGETMQQAVARAEHYVLDLTDAAYPALFVTHCDIIRGIVTKVLAVGFDRLLALPCSPGSLTRLMLDENGLHLVTLNECPAPSADQ